MDTLPLELLYEMFNYMNVDDVDAFCNTCKSYKTIHDIKIKTQTSFKKILKKYKHSNYIFKNVNFDVDDFRDVNFILGLLNTKDFVFKTYAINWLEFINANGGGMFDSDTYMRIEMIENYSNIIFKSIRIDKNSDFIKLCGMNNINNIENLKIYNTKFEDGQLEKFINLKNLSLCNCDLTNVTVSCKKLMKISLFDCNTSSLTILSEIKTLLIFNHRNNNLKIFPVSIENLTIKNVFKDIYLNLTHLVNLKKFETNSNRITLP
jgi:hypothetical protein